MFGETVSQKAIGISRRRQKSPFWMMDEYRGETVRAFVSLKEGYKGKVTEEEMIEHCKKNLAIFKVPKSVEFIEEIPNLQTLCIKI